MVEESAARTDWKSLPLEEKPFALSAFGSSPRGAKGERKPPSDEGGGPKGRRERFRCTILSALREKRNQALSPSQLR